MAVLMQVWAVVELGSYGLAGREWSGLLRSLEREQKL